MIPVSTRMIPVSTRMRQETTGKKRLFSIFENSYLIFEQIMRVATTDYTDLTGF
jgi:hypothetical protein